MIASSTPPTRKERAPMESEYEIGSATESDFVMESDDDGEESRVDEEDAMEAEAYYGFVVLADTDTSSAVYQYMLDRGFGFLLHTEELKKDAAAVLASVLNAGGEQGRVWRIESADPDVKATVRVAETNAQGRVLRISHVYAGDGKGGSGQFRRFIELMKAACLQNSCRLFIDNVISKRLWRILAAHPNHYAQDGDPVFRDWEVFLDA